MAENTSSEKFLPIAGIAAGVLFAVGAFAGKVSEKYADPQGLEIMKDNLARNIVAAVASAFFCVAMVFFVSALRRALRPASGEETTWTNALFAGGVLVAASQALGAWVMFAALDAADQGNEASFQAISYLGIDSWLPWVTGSAVFYLAVGLAGLRSVVLPRWFAIVSVVLGVLCMLGPAGIAVYLVTPLWLAAAGVLVRPVREPSRDFVAA